MPDEMERYLAKESKAEKAYEWELEPATLGYHLVVTWALPQLVLAPMGVLEQATTELLAGTDSNETRWRYHDKIPSVSRILLLARESSSDFFLL